MKNFVIDIIIGLVVFCTIWWLGELVFDCFKGQNEYSYKYEYVKNSPNIKTLLIGNSYFENGINPYLLGDSVFDFAINGRWIYYDAVLAKRLFPTMSNLQVVVIPIGYHQLYTSPHYTGFDHVHKEYAYKYAQYMDVDYDEYPMALFLKSALINNHMGIKFWADETIDSLGYLKLEGKQDNWEEIHNVPENLLKNKYADVCYEEYKNYLMEIAKVCYANDIRLIAVTCPCADCYIVNTCEKGIQNLYDLVNNVNEVYPIEYKNYIDDPLFRADSIYYNSSHLNSIGADLFAKKLKEDFGL